MRLLVALFGFLLLFVVLWDTFETIVLPRTVAHRVRLSRLFYKSSWTLLSAAVRWLPFGRGGAVLNAFGPLSLIFLFLFWALCLIFSFALIQWGLHSPVLAPEGSPTFGTYLYLSGTTFFTLGYGDVTPNLPLARTISVGEAGCGFGFLAIVIGYLPVMYQAFSRREVGISLLDARASSPPSAAELLRRHAEAGCMEALTPLLQEWERWAAELLESHLSFPVLVYYRSQHDRESWLAALTTVLDTCALIRLGFEGDPAWQKPLVWQAYLTSAMAQHAVIDLALIFNIPPEMPKTDRLPPEDLARLRAVLKSAEIPLRDGAATDQDLIRLRSEYEPYVFGLAARLFLTLPPWMATDESKDNWQTSAWGTHFH